MPRGWEQVTATWDEIPQHYQPGDVFRLCGDGLLESYHLGTDIPRRDISAILVEALEGPNQEHGQMSTEAMHRVLKGARGAMTEAVLQVIDFLVENDNIDAAIEVRRNFIPD